MTSGSLNLSIPDNDKNDMYSRVNERSELEQFRNKHSSEDLDEFVDNYEHLWRQYFEENMDKKYPLHPWKILKHARAEYAKEENDGDWPSLPKRHALRVVKDEFAEEWREYSASFNSGEQ